MDDRQKLVALALLGLMCLFIISLGIGTALNIAFDIGIQSGVMAAAMGWLMVLAVGSLSVLGTLWLTLGALAAISDAGQKRLKNPDKTYTQFIGVVVGLFAGFINDSLQNDPILSLLLGLVVAIISTAAAHCMSKHLLLGSVLYFLVVFIVVFVVAMTTSGDDLRRWLIDRTAQDWVLIAITIVIALGVPISVWQIERYRREPDNS